MAAAASARAATVVVVTSPLGALGARDPPRLGFGALAAAIAAAALSARDSITSPL